MYYPPNYAPRNLSKLPQGEWDTQTTKLKTEYYRKKRRYTESGTTINTPSRPSHT